MPTDAALSRLRALLRPGGRLVVVGCYRQVGWRDRLVDVVAVPANLVIGLTRRRHAATARVAMSAPVATATDPLDDVRRAAVAALGTYRLRRRVFWRYTLTHTKR